MADAKEQRLYLDLVEKRCHRSNRAVLLRVVGIQTAWSATLLAGAAIPVAQALAEPGNFEWVVSLLGFVVVVAAGADRLFARTRGTVEAHDMLRRSLRRERRLMLAGKGSYADGDAFDTYVTNVEAAIADYDQRSHKYTVKLSGSSPD